MRESLALIRDIAREALGTAHAAHHQDDFKVGYTAEKTLLRIIEADRANQLPHRSIVVDIGQLDSP